MTENEMSDTKAPKEFWDEESVYDDLISPLMTKIIDICNKHKIPMIASFAYANKDPKSPNTPEGHGGIGFCTTIINNIDKRRVVAFEKAYHDIRPPEPAFLAYAVTKEGVIPLGGTPEQNKEIAERLERILHLEERLSRIKKLRSV
jgi:hypothetical protein